MSVNFNKPHAVDVPVRDLDDPDDDYLFAEAQTRTGRPSSAQSVDSMDYTDSGARGRFGAGRLAGAFSKITNYFSPPLRTQNYELMPNGSDVEFFNVDDDSSFDDQNGNFRNMRGPGSESNTDLRKFEIKRLERKLNKTILAFFCLLVFVFAVLFIQKDSAGAAGSSPISKIVLTNSTHNFHPTTLMISLDGFHPHYINEQNTPALHNMLKNGYGAPYMEPSFPSSTFPNHWTLVTGLYPADHGVVGNTFFDPRLEKQFINTDPAFGLDPQFWQGGEPLWTTAAKQGVNSAIHMWPGSEVPGVGDNGPLFVDRYNGNEPLSAKAARIFEWIDTPDLAKRPELILAYVPTIDQFGHKYGIAGPELEAALHDVDAFVQSVLDSLAARSLQDIVNVVVVSDHGMAPTSNERLLFLDDIVDMAQIEHTDGWPLYGLRPKANVSSEDIYAEMTHKMSAQGATVQDNFNIYKVEEFPPEWQFGGKIDQHTFNYRLAPLWVVPNVGYSVTTKAQFEKNGNQYYPKGVHGYNNTQLLMRAVFLGAGPYFEKKLVGAKKVTPFSNVNVYNIICDTLELKPSANNGSFPADKTFSVSVANELPDTWTDHLVYPDLPYEVEHIVKNATYDLLYRPVAKNIEASSKVEEPSSFFSTTAESSSSIGKSSKTPEPTPHVSFPQSGHMSKTHASEATHTHKGGFFGDLLGDVGHFIDEVDHKIEGAVDDALDYVDGLLNGDH